MNYNIFSYFVYLPVTFFITIRVGWIFFKNGQHYIDGMIPNDPSLARFINRMLLLGYYLMNLGYVTVIVSIWNKMETLLQVCNELSLRIGIIMLTLGILHFINIVIIWQYGHQKKHPIHSS